MAAGPWILAEEWGGSDSGGSKIVVAVGPGSLNASLKR